MRKSAFAYFYGLCILISFSLLTITVRGLSNKHCLLPFFIFDLINFILAGKEDMHDSLDEFEFRQICNRATALD